MRWPVLRGDPLPLPLLVDLPEPPESFLRSSEPPVEVQAVNETEIIEHYRRLIEDRWESERTFRGNGCPEDAGAPLLPPGAAAAARDG